MPPRPRANRLARPNSDAIIAAFAFQLVLWLASGVSNEGGSSPLFGPLAGCFLALGSGLGLVGTVSARRGKRAKKGGKMGEVWSKTCEQGRDRRDHLGQRASADAFRVRVLSTPLNLTGACPPQCIQIQSNWTSIVMVTARRVDVVPNSARRALGAANIFNF